MKFSEAVDLMRCGKSVRRVHWTPEHCMAMGPFGLIEVSDRHQCLPAAHIPRELPVVDVLADDWEVVE